MSWSVLKPCFTWTWKGLQEEKKKSLRVESQGCALGDKEMSHVSHDTGPTGKWVFRKVRANQQVCIGLVFTHVVVIRRLQSRNISLFSRRRAWQKMKNQRSGSENVGPESSQHRAGSFFNHEQTLPKVQSLFGTKWEQRRVVRRSNIWQSD